MDIVEIKILKSLKHIIVAIITVDFQSFYFKKTINVNIIVYIYKMKYKFKLTDNMHKITNAATSLPMAVTLTVPMAATIKKSNAVPEIRSIIAPSTSLTKTFTFFFKK